MQEYTKLCRLIDFEQLAGVVVITTLCHIEGICYDKGKYISYATV